MTTAGCNQKLSIFNVKNKPVRFIDTVAPSGPVLQRLRLADTLKAISVDILDEIIDPF